MLFCHSVQENSQVKCYRYFPPDEKEDGKPDYVQFEQVQSEHSYIRNTDLKHYTAELNTTSVLSLVCAFLAVPHIQTVCGEGEDSDQQRISAQTHTHWRGTKTFAIYLPA